MRVALVQMTVLAGQPDENRRHGLAMLAAAAALAEVVVLPEIWTTGYALRQVAELSEDEDGPTLSGVREIAVRHGVTVVAGSLPLRRDGSIYNRSVVIGPDGSTVAGYEKAHLFSFTGEERFFAAGGSRTTFTVGGFTAGLAICYELRFPELFRALRGDGASLFFLPAEWPAARAEHWLTLTRARAIENQAYLCAVNCVGEHRGSPFCGLSAIIGPSGETIAAGGAEEAIIIGDIDPTAAVAAREGMPVWADRRPVVYR